MKLYAAPARVCGPLVLALVAALLLWGQGGEPVSGDLRPVATTTTIFGPEVLPARVQRAHRGWELGLRFTAEREGRVVALRYYRGGRDRATHAASLWSSDGTLLAQTTFSASTERGWQLATLADPVSLSAATTYVVSYRVRRGDYFAVRPQEFARRQAGGGPLSAETGVWAGAGDFPYLDGPRSNYLVDVAFVEGPADTETGQTTSASPSPSASSSPSTTPSTPGAEATPTSTPPSSTPTAAPTSEAPTSEAPTTEPTSAAPTTTAPTSAAPTTTAPPTTTPPTTAPPTPAPGGFPGPSDTGVPGGTTLTRYAGPCTIRTAVTLQGVDASDCGALLIRAAGVTIRDSLLPRIDLTEGDGESATITDSTIDGGAFSDGAVWGSNASLARVEIIGGKDSVHCADNCTVVDSWLHGQYNPDGQSYHNQAFLTNGGTGMVLRHNTLHCTAVLNSTDGGCTADVSLFGDFDPVSDVLVENNYLRANDSSVSYCAYGGYEPSKRFPVATRIRYVDNVFERGSNDRCGVFGPVTSFQSSASGNLWSGNVWSDGGQLQAG